VKGTRAKGIIERILGAEVLRELIEGRPHVDVRGLLERVHGNLSKIEESEKRVEAVKREIWKTVGRFSASAKRKLHLLSHISKSPPADLFVSLISSALSAHYGEPSLDPAPLYFASNPDDWVKSYERLWSKYQTLLEEEPELRGFERDIFLPLIERLQAQLEESKNRIADQDELIEKFRKACLARGLKKGKTIPLKVLIEIAKEIGISGAESAEAFRPGTSAYHVAREYASRLGYKRKGAAQFR